MSRPISIGVASDTREFTSGIKKGVIEPLDDAVRSLDEVQREGDKAGDRLEGAFEKAQREVSDFKREQAETARKTSRDWKDAGDDIGKNVKRGTDDGIDAVQEFKNEAKSNLSETVSSFDGSVESLADGLQGTLGGLAGSLGPAGLVGAGILGAVVGVATQSVIAWDEKQKEIAEGFGSMYQAAIDEGRAYLTEAEIVAEAVSIMNDPERRKEAKKDAESLGLTLSDIAKAQAGDQEAINTVLDRTKQKQDDILAGKIEQGTRVEYELRDLGSLEGRYTRIKEIQQEAKEVAEESLQLIDESKKAEDRRAQAAVAGLDQQGKRLQALADQGIPDKTVRVRVDQTELDAMYRKLSNGATVAVSPRVAEAAAAGRFGVP